MIRDPEIICIALDEIVQVSLGERNNNCLSFCSCHRDCGAANRYLRSGFGLVGYRVRISAMLESHRSCFIRSKSRVNVNIHAGLRLNTAQDISILILKLNDDGWIIYCLAIIHILCLNIASQNELSGGIIRNVRLPFLFKPNVNGPRFDLLRDTVADPQVPVSIPVFVCVVIIEGFIDRFICGIRDIVTGSVITVQYHSVFPYGKGELFCRILTFIFVTVLVDAILWKVTKRRRYCPLIYVTFVDCQNFFRVIICPLCNRCILAITADFPLHVLQLEFSCPGVL